MDTKIEVSPRTLKALLDQAYKQGKLDEQAAAAKHRESEAAFNNMFGNIFGKQK